MTGEAWAAHDDVRGRWGPGRILAAAVLVATFGFWVWAFSPWAPRGNPDRLSDRDFAAAAEDRCAEALTEIAAVPSARAASSPGERAVQVATGTEAVEALVADLRDLASQVSDDDERDILDKWFADWDQYVADRWDHHRRLTAATPDTSDTDLRFVLSAVVGGGIYTERLDGFARVNDMDSCTIPGDL